MDLYSVTELRSARFASDLVLAPGETLLGGGTWLFSEPQPGVTGLVDLTTMGWADHEVVGDVLRLGATCTIERLASLGPDVLGTAAEQARLCAEALLMSFKVQHAATLGGNLCLALPAGAMIGLFSGLGADVVLETPAGDNRRMAVASFVTDVSTTDLRPGEVLRAVEVPVAALTARHAVRQISMAPMGRSSSLVTGRIDGDRSITVVVTAATRHPVMLKLAAGPAPADIDAALSGIDCWYADPHGPDDWRRAVTAGLVHEVVGELGAL